MTDTTDTTDTRSRWPGEATADRAAPRRSAEGADSARLYRIRSAPAG